MVGLDRLFDLDVRVQPVAGRVVGVFLELVAPDAADLVVRRFQGVVGHQCDLRAGTLFDTRDIVALFVEQKARDRDGQLHDDATGSGLHRLLFEQAQNRKRQRLDAANAAAAQAARAGLAGIFGKRRLESLARHFEQAETRDSPDLNPRTVGLGRLLETVLDLALVLVVLHVDEIDHDQPAEIANTQLACDFIRRFEVRVEGGFLDAAALGGARRVDVDGGHGLGVVDHDRPAGGQGDFPLECALDLRLDLEAGEERRFVGVMLELVQRMRHDLLHELAAGLVDVGLIDDHFADIVAQVVAQGANDDVGFLIDQEGRLALGRGVADRLPYVGQVVEIPLEFLGTAADAGGAHDHAHAVGDLNLVEGLAQFVAVFTLDATRHAARTRVVRHQDQIPSGQAHEGGQRGALVATLLLLDLDDDLLTFGQRMLDAVLAIVLAAAVLILVEIFLGDFLERQEAVAIAAVIDEGGFEAGLDARDAALVDVGLALFAAANFDI